VTPTTDHTVPGNESAASFGSGHSVQFYEDDAYLVGAVAGFLAQGLIVGQPIVVIATETHRTAFAQRLSYEGFDVEAATSSGQLKMLDARATLDTLMIGATPDPGQFKMMAERVLGERATAGASSCGVRLYGEMVDLLCRDGNADGALRLEELWNELAHDYAFSLLCGYSMGNFHETAHATRFQEICCQHTHVVPTEHFVRADAEMRLLEVSLLQQRARSLESEIEHRKDLERRLGDRERELREVLDERDALLARISRERGTP
jgi:hypothetical protein